MAGEEADVDEEEVAAAAAVVCDERSNASEFSVSGPSPPFSIDEALRNGSVMCDEDGDEDEAEASGEVEGAVVESFCSSAAFSSQKRIFGFPSTPLSSFSYNDAQQQQQE